MEYRIAPNNVHSYAVREAAKIVIIFIVIFSLLLLVLNTQIQGSANIFDILRPRLHWLLLIIAYIGGMTYYQRRNIGKSIVYLVTDEGVAKIINNDKLNIGNKIGMAKSERYNSKANQNISKIEISKIKTSNNGIGITSVDYNFFNGNGYIFIPKEVNNYKQAKKELEKMKNQLRV